MSTFQSHVTIGCTRFIVSHVIVCLALRRVCLTMAAPLYRALQENIAELRSDLELHKRKMPKIILNQIERDLAEKRGEVAKKGGGLLGCPLM